MYVRYTQPPGDLFDWYEEYLQDEEEVDVKAGGGQVSSLSETIFCQIWTFLPISGLHFGIPISEGVPKWA